MKLTLSSTVSTEILFSLICIIIYRGGDIFKHPADAIYFQKNGNRLYVKIY